MQQKDVRQVSSIIQDYAMREDGDERGGAKHRYTEKRIDRSTGTGAGYIVKYISKNIDGFGLDCDIDGGEPTDAAERVNVWARTWAKRQFQRIGEPPVTVWRELRCLGGVGVAGELQELQDATDKGEWDRFVMLMGGPEATRKDFPISVFKQTTDELSRYREPKEDKITGLTWKSVVFPTRLHRWTIEHKREPNKMDKPIELKGLANKSGAIIALHQINPSPLEYEYCQ
jgi:hypothetical protein